MLYPRQVGDQLEAVPVPGGDGAPVPGPLTHAGEGAQQIVGLKALFLNAQDAHGVQHFLQQRHLRRQLLRHPLPLGLVAVIAQMAEGGGLQVKGHRQPLGPLLVQQPPQDGEKAVNGVGGRAVRRVQHTDPEVGPVDNAVSVDRENFHRIHSSGLFGN